VERPAQSRPNWELKGNPKASSKFKRRETGAIEKANCWGEERYGAPGGVFNGGETGGKKKKSWLSLIGKGKESTGREKRVMPD